MDYRTVRCIRAAWYINGHNDSIAFINGIENGIERLFRLAVKSDSENTVYNQSTIQIAICKPCYFNTAFQTASSKYFLGAGQGWLFYRKVRFRHDCRTGKVALQSQNHRLHFYRSAENENPFSVYLSAVKLNNFIYTFFSCSVH